MVQTSLLIPAMWNVKPLFGLAMVLLSGPVHATEMTVRFRAEATNGAEAGPVAVRAIPQGAAGSPRAFTMTVPGEASIDLTEGTAWQVVTEHPGFWSAPEWVSPRPDSRPVALRLFPAAMLTGALSGPPGGKLPSLLDLRLEASPDSVGPKVPLTPLQCPVEQGRFECKVPAGRLDLRLRLSAFIPAYLWDVEAKAGEVKDLGQYALKSGSSVVGWVQTEDSRSAAGANVRLQPQTLGGPAGRWTAEGLKAMTVEGTTNQRGFFQLEVQAGMQVATVEKDGFAGISRPGVEVRPGLETQIPEPLVLTKPLTLHLTLEPPASPSGTPWRILLETRPDVEGLQGPQHRGVAGEAGDWVQGGLSPGRYRISVLEGSEPRLLEEAELAPGRTELHYSLEGVRVRGEVRLGEEPLQAVLWFGGKSGPRRARFESDDQGRFEGLLSQEGTWNVELISVEDDLHIRLPPIDVRKPPGKSHATVEIRVPDTRLQGEVVDEQGKPVPGASILIKPLTRALPSFADTDAEGAFGVRGLVPGPHVVRAEEGDRESEWLQVTLEEERETPSLRLVLQSRVTVSGRVSSARGSVAGARISATADLGEAGAASGTEAVSGPAGEFTLQLPSGTRNVHLTVLAPGYATRMLKVPFAAGQVLEIPVEPAGGSLVLDLGSLTREDLRTLGGGLIAHGGTFVPLDTALRWTELQRAPQADPQRLVLPNMEAGDYTICFGRSAQKAVPRGMEPPQTECARGYLLPLQELTLHLPRSAGDS